VIRVLFWVGSSSLSIQLPSPLFPTMKLSLLSLAFLLLLSVAVDSYKIVKSVPVSAIGPAWRSMRVRQFANSSPQLLGFAEGGFRPRFGAYKRGYDYLLPQ
ncbi:hypothetical protein PFISCL1PPCAC_8113, partial [Pristionchus fissidentatus]